jgi:hypothetical protein
MCPACVVVVVIGAMSIQGVRALAKSRPRLNQPNSTVESSKSDEQLSKTLQYPNSQEK